MTIELNGSPRELPDGASIADAVAASGATSGEAGVAVAVDGEVVRRDDWRAFELCDGQTVEVVRAVQGG
jgi:sulfur carrier protein